MYFKIWNLFLKFCNFFVIFSYFNFHIRSMPEKFDTLLTNFCDRNGKRNWRALSSNFIGTAGISDWPDIHTVGILPFSKTIRARFQKPVGSLHACLEQSRCKYQKDYRSNFMTVMIGKSSNWLHVEFVLNAFLRLKVLT